MPLLKILQLECEGPRCSRSQNGGKMVLQWDPSDAKNVPEQAFKFINDQFLAEASPEVGPHTFCCRRCQHDYHLDNPFSPKSPKEAAEQQEFEQQRQAAEPAQAKQTFKVPVVGTDPIPPITPPLAISATAESSPESGRPAGDGYLPDPA